MRQVHVGVAGVVLLASWATPAANAQSLAAATETAVVAPAEQPRATETPGPRVEFRFEKRPSLRLGNASSEATAWLSTRTSSSARRRSASCISWNPA